MERINISFTPQELERMRQYKEETGIGISELLRRLVDEFFGEYEKVKRLEYLNANPIEPSFKFEHLEIEPITEKGTGGDR